MFRAKGKLIEITRGDEGGFTLRAKNNQTFKEGDQVKFAIYGEAQLDKAPVLKKIITVEEETETVSFYFSSEDTKIGEICNETQIFWYEIEINGKRTPIGYDSHGAKLIYLYPEGSDEEDV